MKFRILTEYITAGFAEVELPVDSWSEVKDWYVKWQHLNYTLDGETWLEIDLGVPDETDLKRPDAVRVLGESWDEVLDER